ncbi:cytochrome P450 CYP736A12-like [Pyrus ussuriensis x Pyrus communis]|uniref:Cytochrome P450 CYP736A12-like n=1 Tax=Pyrus ussuriensis x Pyrus communis TaxID=2448454 RepID=A0A5N5GZJ1_9ROSA|nr:cytochrome P450 CYP736A12-like [Pyrus ussuriensis x Pyrus communis]
MAASISDSTKGWEGEGFLEAKGKKKLLKKKMKKVVVTLERYQRKCLPSFDDKSLAEKCSIEFNSWKMVPVDLNDSMVQELSRKYVDDLFKKQFQQWKFDLQRATECTQVDNAAIDDLADDPEEE